MALTYTTYVSTIANLATMDESNTDFVQILPSIINYAEDRIYRELDMLVENVRDASASTTANNRNFNLPTTLGVYTGPLDGINIITPASTSPDSGTRNRLTPVSLDVLDFTYPSSESAGVPTQFAYFSQSTSAGQYNIVFGPWPDATYRVEVIGKIQPTALSVSNPTTYLSNYLPDLLLAASMVFVAGWQQNYGRQSDNAGQAMSWEQQYQTLKSSADTWEARKRFSGASWTSKPVEPSAAPQRG